MENLTENNQPSFVVSSPSCFDSKNPSEFDKSCSYRVAWSINAHMKVGTVNQTEAFSQHEQFKQTLLESGAKVFQVPFVQGAYDSVFVKDNALLGQTSRDSVAFLANPLNKERKVEQSKREEDLRQLGFNVIGRAKWHFEGGDLVKVPNLNAAFMGYGFRSERKVATQISEAFGLEITPLKLEDPFFYHLDTALAILNDGSAFACPEAFSSKSWKELKKSSSIRTLVSVSRTEALKFALNWVEIEDTVILGSHVPKVKQALENMGKKVHVVPLNQFQFAGGSAACLTSQIHKLSS